MEKTNVMRILDQKKIPYHHYEYDNSQAYSGTEVADMLGQDPKVVYKTLVTVAKQEELCICHSGRRRTGFKKGSQSRQ